MSSSVQKLGLSFSGGGYRAAAFHIGTLKKLHELHILEKVDVLSTISGGSITGAYYCLRNGDFKEFESNIYDLLLQKNVIARTLFSFTFLKFVFFLLLFLVPAVYFLFTSHAWLFPVLIIALIFSILKFQFILFPVSKRIENVYDDFFYHKKQLSDLPDHPALVISSTNLQTARPFTFAKNRMQDSTYQYMENPVKFNAANFPIARAVMASSCVPFAFTPVSIEKKYFQKPEDAQRVHPILVDGGVYDNQGIHKVMQKGFYACSTIITSDAGGGSTGQLRIKNTLELLIATMDVFMLRIKNVQMQQDVYDNAGNTNKEIAYLSLAWDAENLIPGFINNLADNNITEAVIKALGLLPEWVADPKFFEKEITAYLKEKTNYDAIPKPTAEEKSIARKVGTNLTSLTKQQIDCLIKQAECLTELQVKLYCPSLITMP
jgi:NTE family protein